MPYFIRFIAEKGLNPLPTPLFRLSFRRQNRRIAKLNLAGENACFAPVTSSVFKKVLVTTGAKVLPVSDRVWEFYLVVSGG